MEDIKTKAKFFGKTIVLPEGTEKRIIKATAAILAERIAQVVLLGNEGEIKAAAEEEKIDVDKATIIDPFNSEKSEYYAERLVELRKHKGMKIEKARKLIRNPLYYGAMMVKEDDADGLVAGATNPTSDVLRPALQIIKTKPGISVVSGALIMALPHSDYGEHGLFVFADCAVNPNPNAEQLAEIAIASAHTAKALAGIEPRVGMLSFSTYGSAKHEMVNKVRKATLIAKEKANDLIIDGEMQVDAAIVPEVGASKAPGSDVAGRANILVFPDLEAGNIGYKLVQRLALAEAIGPILQGMAKPVNDLSRGCSVEDIINVISITAVLAGEETKEAELVKVLVINCGSSSLKYQLYDMKDEVVIARGAVEKIGLNASVLKHQEEDGGRFVQEVDAPNHDAAFSIVVDTLTNPQTGVVSNIKEIAAVGHRIVHGGTKFFESALVTDEVINDIRDCIDLAPLHNPAHIMGIKAAQHILPGIPQVTVFDTAFHQTMPNHAYLYAVPYELYEKYKVRRYGAHGTSHFYVSQQAMKHLGRKEDTRIITCHLGNGASMAAVKNGKCIDTSMGMTPLEGLMMGTRCGDIDPALVSYIIKKENISVDEIDNYLNKKSGMLGVSGISSDLREVAEAAYAGNERAQVAINMYAYRVKKYIGQYAAAMGGLDAIVFTAGIGENSWEIRRKVCKGLEFMGVEIDTYRNDNYVHGHEELISTPNSKVKVFIIPTNEELVIAEDTKRIVEKIPGFKDPDKERLAGV